MEQRRKSVAVEIGNIYSEVTKGGMLQSGRTVVQVGEAVENEYRVRAAIALGVWRRGLGAAGVAPTGLRADLVAEIATTLERDSQDLAEHYGHVLEVTGTNTTYDPATGTAHAAPQAAQGGRNPQQVLLTMRSKALDWVASEFAFDIAAAASNAEAARHGTTTFNIYGGQVGAIQTGPGATAAVNQSELDQILRALRDVKRVVQETQAIGDAERVQIVEVVDEAVTEAQKPKPNRLALRSLMSGIATSVQTLGAARPAYDILKGVLALLGVHLP